MENIKVYEQLVDAGLTPGEAKDVVYMLMEGGEIDGYTDDGDPIPVC
jgi:hypothetical protein